MATVHFTKTTTATPEEFIAALTDFGPGRAEIWGNTADSQLEVYSQSPGHADVKEGTSATWERLDYDWTNPERVVLKTTDSNTWGRNSGYTYTLKRGTDGTTTIDIEIVREGKNLKGRFLELVISTVGKGVLPKTYDKSLKAIEARSKPANASEAAPIGGTAGS
jgi:hypothetical protein